MITMRAMATLSVAVLGAGVSGLAAALATQVDTRL
jgi:predicted NAD/FAD-binding protein